MMTSGIDSSEHGPRHDESSRVVPEREWQREVRDAAADRE